MAELLIVIEHDREQVKHASLHAITLARQLGGEYALLVLGHSLDGIAASLVSYGAICSDCSRRPGIGGTVGRPLRDSDRGSSARVRREDRLGYFLDV